MVMVAPSSGQPSHGLAIGSTKVIIIKSNTKEIIVAFVRITMLKMRAFEKDY